MICLYTVIFRRLRQREKARFKRRNLRRSRKNPHYNKSWNNLQSSTLRLIENERISSALIGGAHVARQVGAHIKTRTDQMLKELSLRVYLLQKMF